MDFKTVAFVAAPKQEAQNACRILSQRYENVSPQDADIIVALGGDGFMLRTLHEYMSRGVPIFGMNQGSVGFLMNDYRADNLCERLSRAESIRLHPLRMTAWDIGGDVHEALAINEVSVLRQTRLASKIRINIDGVIRVSEMICDGLLVATPAGSTAYNAAVQGTILPLGADLLALTPISVFRPRRWRGALLPHDTTVVVEILDAEDRQVSTVADDFEVRDVLRVEIREDRNHSPVLLFDPEHNLEERIIKEQFVP